MVSLGAPTSTEIDPTLASYRSFVLNLLKVHSVKVAAPGEFFTLASGAKSRWYIDVKKTALNSKAHFPLAYILYDELAQGIFGGIEAVAGVVLGGCHLASIVAMYASTHGKTALDVVYVRKEAKDHGTKALVEHSTMRPDKPIVLLEDVVTTGGSSVKALYQLRETGYDIRGILAVIDRRDRDARSEKLEGVPFRSLFVLDDFEA